MKKVGLFLLLICICSDLVANNIFLTFDNNMSFHSLLGFVRMYYSHQIIHDGDFLYLYNKSTNVAYEFDYRIYYLKICHLKQHGNGKKIDDYICVNIPNHSYQRMPGGNKKYNQNSIMTALHQPQNYYFGHNHNLNMHHADSQTRAIALLSEAVRFKAISKALINGGIAEAWQYSWGTVALNWASITHNQFNVPVSIELVCHYMSNRANSVIREHFYQNFNPYLQKNRCKPS